MESDSGGVIAIRADASVSMGSGHVVRCLTLADALRKRGAKVSFLCRPMSGDMCGRIRDEGFDVLQLDPTSDDADACRAALAGGSVLDVLVVDHYALDTGWEHAMRPLANRIAVIDDLADRRHDCDLLIDQNFHRHADERYVGLVPGGCRLLLGPRYAMLRPQFAATRDRLESDAGRSLRRLLICFGGMDELDYTARAVAAFIDARLPGVSATVVVGQAYPHWAALESKCRLHDHIRLHRNVANMAELMAQADLFLGSGGSITWERAALKLPGITIAIADNQRTLCRELAEAGAGVHLDVADDALAAAIKESLGALLREPQQLRTFSERIGELCDGRGAARVTRYLLPAKLELRRARPEDCDNIYAWRNDPVTRRYSGNPAPLDIADHRAWYARTLADPSRQILIAEQGAPARPVGILRYDMENSLATISVYLVPGLQGAGLGTALIAAGDRWLREHHPDIRTVVAEVRVDNTASAAAFASAGYRMESRRLIHDLADNDHD